jgi:hypothetical protein
MSASASRATYVLGEKKARRSDPAGFLLAQAALDVAGIGASWNSIPKIRQSGDADRTPSMTFRARAEHRPLRHA